MHVERHFVDADTVAGHQVGFHEVIHVGNRVHVHVGIHVGVHAQAAKPCFQAHQQDDMLDDDEDDGPEEEEEASEPEMRVAKRKRVPVPRPSAGTPVKPESLEEVEQRLQPGSVKHAIFQVHDSFPCAPLNPLAVTPSGQLFKAAQRARDCHAMLQSHIVSLCFWCFQFHCKLLLTCMQLRN